MPWSSVYSIATSTGSIYLKQTAQPFAIEVILLPYLINVFPEILLKIVATNQDLLCFLMRDAGYPLRDYLRVNYQGELANKGFRWKCKRQGNITIRTIHNNNYRKI